MLFGSDFDEDRARVVKAALRIYVEHETAVAERMSDITQRAEKRQTYSEIDIAEDTLRQIEREYKEWAED